MPTVVIIGAGFGGLNAAKALHGAAVQIVLIDRRNYHLFQPLLYQVATAGLAPTEIAYPVRTVFRNQPNLKFRLADVTAINLAARQVETSAGPVSYDYLILSVGSESHYFGLESVAQNGFDLKDLADAEAIRNHILSKFEEASRTEDLHERQALRTFVVVGGGPTGVECAGALSELIRFVLRKDFRSVDVAEGRVILIEMLNHLLPGFPETLGRGALKSLQRKQVEVRLSTAAEGFDGRQVTLKGGQVIPAHTLIWAAGVRAKQVVGSLGVPLAKQGRVPVTPALHLAGHPEVFVIGDAAYLEAGGEPLPMMAPVAIQQAKTAARNVRHSLAGEPLEAFSYRDPGSLATIGRNEAVARIGRFRFHGFVAWLVWLVVHLYWLIGFRNRLFVVLSWAWAYLLFENSVRLIVPRRAEPADRQGAATTRG